MRHAPCSRPGAHDRGERWSDACVRSDRVRASALGRAALRSWAARRARPRRAAADERRRSSSASRTLEQQVAILKRKLEVRGGDAGAQATAPPWSARAPTASSSRRRTGVPGARSAATRSSTRAGSAERRRPRDRHLLFRRVRPIVEGTLAECIDFRIMPDFANSTLVAPGRLREPALLGPSASSRSASSRRRSGSSGSQSATAIRFVERALPTLLVPNRDLGVDAAGRAARGPRPPTSSRRERRDDGSTTRRHRHRTTARTSSARVFVHPFQETRSRRSRARRRLRDDYGRPQPARPRTIQVDRPADTSSRTRRGVTLDEATRALLAAGVLVLGAVRPAGRVRHRSSPASSRARTTLSARDQAWQVAASYVLTGENTSSSGVIPSRRSISARGDLGAFEIAARYSELRARQRRSSTAASPTPRSPRAAKELGARRQLVPEPLAQAWS